MNCPAKNDDALLKHPTWNQSPSYLAAELTTRQDLNGIANSREHKCADEVTSRCFGGHDEMLDGDSPSGSGGTAEDPEERPYWLSSIKTANSRTPITLGSVEEQVVPATHSSPLHLRSTCPTGGVNSEEYNTPLHVGALFIILFVSTAACVFPLLASKFPSLRIPPVFFFIVRHFGTGVLIATAFVHLLPTAFILLGNPCLSDFWINDYPAIPGAIALAGVFFVIIIEMVFHPSRHMNLTPKAASSGQPGEPEGILNPLSNTPDQQNSESVQVSGLSGRTDGIRAGMDVEKESYNDISLVLTSEQKLQKDVLQCILLEVGILFHSVFIGMALSVSIGNEFIVLLIAIAFHQTFEGLALGSRIANIAWPDSTLKPWFMALAYGCTTPIGQAIGIGLSSLYSPDSEVGLILVGTMNAISAGLLVFASLVELLSEDFLSYESWRMLRVESKHLDRYAGSGWSFSPFDASGERSTGASITTHFQ
ncbi:uncharacterized protein DFL_009109 [Arthrobotrys flagrans]|uniref:Zinc/iron permease n=1 Tax=Arthrobotrys flagrans TaxID=97331 RepID=A0A436ZR04_ARTFL|nr:hypothetical protein DFL_009109 [Arthrobotrys flagrans]